MSLNGADPKPGDVRNELFSFISTGNALPILHEVMQGLAELIASGHITTIDLGAIPFAAGDERILDQILGTGEVHATLNVMGESHIQETAIPGVWRVDHFDARGETQSRFLEITTMPEILKTQMQDAKRGLETLQARLAERRDDARKQEGN